MRAPTLVFGAAAAFAALPGAAPCNNNTMTDDCVRLPNPSHI